MLDLVSGLAASEILFHGLNKGKESSDSINKRLVLYVATVSACPTRL
jgi:hypothetical protein